MTTRKIMPENNEEKIRVMELANSIGEGDYEIYNKLVYRSQLCLYPEPVRKLLEKLCSAAVACRTRHNSKNAELEFQANLGQIKDYFVNAYGVMIEEKPCEQSTK